MTSLSTVNSSLIESTGVASHFAVLCSLLLDGVPNGNRELLETRLPHPNDSEVWLILAVLQGELPFPAAVTSWRRRAALDGLATVLDEIVGRASERPLRILVGGVVVDAHHTLATHLGTGIQRVTHNVIREWKRSHEFTLLNWSKGYHWLQLAEETAHAFHNTPIIPWKSVFVLPELALERPRLFRTEALAEFSGNRTGVIGHDCVPITSPETTGPGMPEAFSLNLSTVARMTKVATTSIASTTEYLGWRDMLASAGLVGPDIQQVPLPIEAIAANEVSADPRKTLGLSESPVILAIGSHEPRKNHLPLLFAAEVLWREGFDFQLVFCGGNSWQSDRFVKRVKELRQDGRQVSSHTKVGDATLDALLREARFTVFPSVNEGFGLPVAESLAVGTPVVTTQYGSMAEIAAGGGALLVDPRDDASIVAALRVLLDGDEVLDRLRAEAAARTTSSWGEYADGLWSFFVDPADGAGATHYPTVPETRHDVD
jgi:glycosyltransferase involved in cell wall biosynthesis